MEEIQQKKVAMISPDGKKSFVPLTEFMSKVRYANLANVKIRDLENNRDYNPTYKKVHQEPDCYLFGEPGQL